MDETLLEAVEALQVRAPVIARRKEPTSESTSALSPLQLQQEVDRASVEALVPIVAPRPTYGPSLECEAVVAESDAPERWVELGEGEPFEGSVKLWLLSMRPLAERVGLLLDAMAQDLQPVSPLAPP